MSIERRNLLFTVAGFAAILTVFAAVLFNGCRVRSVQERDGIGDRLPPPAPAPTTEKVLKMDDLGDFIVAPSSSIDDSFAEMDTAVREDKFFEKLADDLNRSLSLPRDIVFRRRKCGDANAEFDPADMSITVCHELFEHYRKLFGGAGALKPATLSKTFGAVRFAVLHEVGHALIEICDLPVAGGEEDAADRFAIYFGISELRTSGEESVRAAAESFRIESRSETRRDVESSDHLAYLQRAVISLCLLYGSAPAKHKEIVADGLISRERSDGCESEFQKTSESWNKLLRPWRKD